MGNLVKNVVEGKIDEATADLEAVLNQKRDEVIAIAKKEVLSKVMVAGDIK